VLTPFAVDTSFFAPDRVVAAPHAMICSAGLEFRDYDTLVHAEEGTKLRTVIAAASNWSRRRNALAGRQLPANIETCQLGFADLRQLYADAEFVVMPLIETDFQAGVTTILEAMAMARAVVCTRTTGQTDVIVDGITGLYVRPHDASDLRATIERLHGDQELAARLGGAARQYVVEHCDTAVYAHSLAVVVADVVASAR
jgi:glycosyltransferase involved in cell wall biosynthesis